MIGMFKILGTLCFAIYSALSAGLKIWRVGRMVFA